MGQFLYFQRVLIFLAFAFSQTINTIWTPGNAEVLTVISFDESEVSEGDHGLAFFPAAEAEMHASLLLNEAEQGLDHPHSFSFTNPLVYDWPIVFLTDNSLKKWGHIVPALNIRTLLYPFHNFL